MISAARFFGGARKVDLDLDESARIHPAIARVWSINATDTGVTVELPDPETGLADTGLGFPILVVYAAGTDDVEVEDCDGGSVVTIAPGEVALISLVSKVGAGTWRVAKKAAA